MALMQQFLAAVLLVAPAGLVNVVAAAVPDPSTTAIYYPDVIKSGAPPAIKVGTRLTYFGTNSTLAGKTVYLELDRDGTWVERGSHRTFNAATSGGVGYSVVRVGHLDKQVAALNVNNYLLNLADKTVNSPSSVGFVSEAGSALDYWIHPAILKNIKDEKIKTTTISRQPYVIGQRKYNAIRFTTMTTHCYMAEIYDLDTGIKLYHALSQAGGVEAKRFKDDDNLVKVTVGSTFSMTSTLMDVKDVDVPWKSEEPPAWVGQFNEIRYDGTISTINPGFAPLSSRVTSFLTPASRGEGWMRGVLSVTVDNGLPPVPNKVDYMTAHGTIGGLWIPPRALAGLKLNQVIDSNDLTKTQYIVGAINQNFVTISETGSTFRIDFTYNKQSGGLSGVTYQQKKSGWNDGDAIAADKAAMRSGGRRRVRQGFALTHLVGCTSAGCVKALRCRPPRARYPAVHCMS